MKSGFTEFFVRENSLEEKGFKEWVFSPGMLFNSPDKWWGNQGKRDRPHEGLDLCLYGDRREKVLSLRGEMKIPAMYDGIIVTIINDFLGQSVIIEHNFSNSDNNILYTIYGHTIPRDDLQAGMVVKKGEVISTLADLIKSKAGLLPHLHISMGWARENIRNEKLVWDTIGTSNRLVLLDPLNIIDSPYMVLEHGTPQVFTIGDNPPTSYLEKDD